MQDRKTLIREFAEIRPAGGFSVILADQPSKFRTYSAKGEGKSPSAHYDCLTPDQVASFPVDVLAADDCALFAWMTWPWMPPLEPDH